MSPQGLIAAAKLAVHNTPDQAGNAVSIERLLNE